MTLNQRVAERIDDAIQERGLDLRFDAEDIGAILAEEYGPILGAAVLACPLNAVDERRKAVRCLREELHKAGVL